MSLPVLRLHAAKSATAPGSVASTSSSSPWATVFIACAVLTIGIGHFRPRASSCVTVSIGLLSGCVVQHLRSDEDELAGTGIDVEGGNALNAIDEWIQIRARDAEHVH